MRALRPYLLGISLVVVFTVVKVALAPLGRDVPFVLYFGAPVLAALAGGRWPGVFTAALAALVANVLFLSPSVGLDTSLAAMVQSVVFLVEASGVALVCDALIRTRGRLLTERRAQQPVLDETGSLSGVLAFDIDVTDEVRQRRRLEVLQQTTVALSRALTVAEVASIVGLGYLVRDPRGEPTMWVASWTDIDELVRTRSRSERIYRLTTALAATMTTQSVAAAICELAPQTVGSDSTSFYVLDEAQNQLVLAGKHGDRRDIDGYERIALDAPVPLAQLVRDRRARFFESVEAVAAESPAIGEALVGSPFRSWALLPLTSAAGNALGVVAFVFRQPTKFGDEDRQLLTAVAEQCAVALDRARAYEAEAAALRKKDEFLAMLGHELRNPLAPILTVTSLIRLRGSATERELGILERQGQHLVRLVDDLLDVSRITSGKLALRRAPVDVAEVIAQALESASKPFEDKRLRFHADVPRSGLAVRGDHERLVQVMTNLFVNAAKFTPAGKGVAVTATKRDGAVAIEVCDEGEGITADLLPNVFDLFTQARQSSDRSGGGLGLGLAIARSIVIAHGGTIIAHSGGRGHGTTMTVTLPLVDQQLEVVAEGDGAVEACLTAHRHRVLIVDDNEDGAEMLATFFSALGYETLVANDAPEALLVVDETLPDAAILDIGLPGMDGYELAAELRTRLGERTPVLVALTGYAQASDRERALASGFRAHFGKPVDMARLATTFEEILAPASGVVGGRAPAESDGQGTSSR